MRRSRAACLDVQAAFFFAAALCEGGCSVHPALQQHAKPREGGCSVHSTLQQRAGLTGAACGLLVPQTKKQQKFHLKK